MIKQLPCHCVNYLVTIYNPSKGSARSRWEGLSASKYLQAVLPVLVNGRVSHVRVVASKMPVAHPSIPERLSV